MKLAQPRTEFRDEELQELIVSIREIGVLQPIVVRPLAGAVAGGPQYELIMGERRLRATKALGLSSIPAVIKNTADEDMLRDALLENLHRANLNPLEEASAYQQLLADFGITQEQLAERIGLDRAYISKIESGKRRYDQPFLEAVAEALKCEPADLLIRDPSDPEGIWSIYDQLQPVERVQLVEIAKTIKRTGTDG